MATIDLGKIKLLWRGTYNNGTAYAVDDVVSYTDSGITSTYICTAASTGNAPSSSGTAHGSWAYMAKGVAGSPTTTRGDIIYRGASADARLAKGTAGQILKMGANDPEWGADAGGKLLGTAISNYTSEASFSNSVANSDVAHDFSYPDSANCYMDVTINRTSATSNIYVTGHIYYDTSSNFHAFAVWDTTTVSTLRNFGFDEHNNDRAYMAYSFNTIFTASELGSGTGNRLFRASGGFAGTRASSGKRSPNMSGTYSDTPNTTTNYSGIIAMEMEP